MSILNFFVDPQRAVVCVDTAVGRIDGHRRETSKVMHLAHANTLFACRGHLGILAGAFSTSWEEADDFDGIVSTLLERLNQTRGALIDYGQRQGLQDQALVGGQELLCVGWSHSQARVVGLLYQASPGSSFQPGQQADWSLAPGECFTGSEIRRPTSEIELVRAASRQIQWTRQNWGWAGCGEEIGGAPIVGGRLLLAQISPTGFSVRSEAPEHRSDRESASKIAGS